MRGVFSFLGAPPVFFLALEALVTRCLYEVDGKRFFLGRSLIRTQVRTARAKVPLATLRCDAIWALALHERGNPKAVVRGQPLSQLISSGPPFIHLTL